MRLFSHHQPKRTVHLLLPLPPFFLICSTHGGIYSLLGGSGWTGMAEALYAACAEVLSVCQANKDDLEALLHPETGFAPRLREICNQQ